LRHTRWYRASKPRDFLKALKTGSAASLAANSQALLKSETRGGKALLHLQAIYEGKKRIRSLDRKTLDIDKCQAGEQRSSERHQNDEICRAAGDDSVRA
jgi:hypothetical protein